MGVKDLWKLLEPAGRPVKLESLEGLVVGVGKYELYWYQTIVEWVGIIILQFMGDSLHQEIFASNKLFVYTSTREAAMKLKHKRKYSYYGDKGSWHNIEATFPLRKLGHGQVMATIVTISCVKVYLDKGF